MAEEPIYCHKRSKSSFFLNPWFPCLLMGSCLSSRVDSTFSATTKYSRDLNKEKFVSSILTFGQRFVCCADKSSGLYDLHLSSYNSSSSAAHKREGEILSKANVKSFSFNELKLATRNFRSDSVVGEGGFGCVYKGWIDETTLSPAKSGTGLVIAVKRLNPDGFQDDVKCKPLSWILRIKVALDAAKGLAFLHSDPVKVIYRDIKASNILLDSDFNGKLSDFGLARDGPMGETSYVSTRVMGTFGYAAPEYVSTGHLNAKSDVYSFGVVLLEILSGRRALDNNRPAKEQNLVDWARPYLTSRRKVLLIVDTRLNSQYKPEEAVRMASIAVQCISSEPKSRPTMDQVVRALIQLQESMAKPGKVDPVKDTKKVVGFKTEDKYPKNGFNKKEVRY
ncbi:unnamed protein product [Thlaspi arvense]|uniref:Protein kinase domain-containing protein n=1 Tax=Thlaspi arvense TaxID=13288 RepID=A0AAU9SDA7_THLAR|nr:unnamed protein product [Thlaspi arvense]